MGMGKLLLPLIGLLYMTDALSLTKSDKTRFSSSAWLEYTSGRKGLPDCCGESDKCQMVRINNALLSDVKRSGSGTYQSNSGPLLTLSASYDKELGGLKGRVTKKGVVYHLDPLSASQRTDSKCGISRQLNSLNLFHTLTTESNQIIKGAPPTASRTLSLPYLLQADTSSEAPNKCCPGSKTCMKVSYNQNALSKTSIRVPKEDGSDLVLVLGLTFPKSSCKNGLCDVYYFKGKGKNSAYQLQVNTNSGSVLLTGGAEQLRLSSCFSGHIWASYNPQQEAGSKGSPALDPFGRTVHTGSDCWYNKTKYCDHNIGQMASPIKAEGVNCEQKAKYCQEECEKIPGCKFFTFFQGRLNPKCYFLDECLERRNTGQTGCLDQENCLSGKINCVRTTPGIDSCTAPVALKEKFTPWSCTDLNNEIIKNYNDSLPTGTQCVQRCSNWIGQDGRPGYLVSECYEGQWTETKAQDGNPSLALPAGPYAEPDDHDNTADEPLQVCSCEPLELRWPPNDPAGFSYDPNMQEKAAEFICDTPISNSSGPVTILPGNECKLFCDRHHFVTVMCVDGEWTGHPDRGIWCYTRPDGNGTCGENCIGTWMEWGPWSSCDLTNADITGSGMTTRTRECSGGICEGAPEAGQQQKTCCEWSTWGACDQFTGLETREKCGDSETRRCPVDGGWSEWHRWGACDPFTGSRTRARTCTNPYQRNGGSPCPNFPLGATETGDCPVPGNWCEWGAWGSPNVTTCQAPRSRVCACPPPLNGGDACPGNSTQEGPQPVNGNWGEWGAWTTPDQSGVKWKFRNCDSPAALCGGETCQGPAYNSTTDPVNGNWCDWGEWSAVNQTTGYRRKTRACQCPPPNSMGSSCPGPGTESEYMRVNGTWCTWGAWSTPNPSTGASSRFRSCACPAALHGGAICPGEPYQTTTFAVNGTWCEWGGWSETDLSTGNATRYRDCRCPSPLNGGLSCPGSNSDSKPGPVDGGYTLWTPWTPEDANLKQHRFRTCTNPLPKNGGRSCLQQGLGPDKETKANKRNGGYTEWGEWSAMDANRVVTRSRSCTNPTTLNGGLNCLQQNLGPETQNKYIPYSPVHGGYTLWTAWTVPDPVTWTSTRYRTCTNPEPANGGLTCIQQNLGPAAETKQVPLVLTVTVKTQFDYKVVPNPTAQELLSLNNYNGDSSGTISIPISAPSNYDFKITAPDHFPGELTVNLNGCNRECQTSYEVLLYKKAPSNGPDMLCITMRWWTDAEDLDLTVMTAPNGWSKASELCKMFWARNDEDKDIRCSAFKLDDWSSDQKRSNEPGLGMGERKEWGCYDKTQDFTFAFAPENKMLYRGVNMTVEDDKEIKVYKLPVQESPLPGTHPAWFVGCSSGVDITIPGTYNKQTREIENPIPLFFNHQWPSADWIQMMHAYCPSFSCEGTGYATCGEYLASDEFKEYQVTGRKAEGGLRRRNKSNRLDYRRG